MPRLRERMTEPRELDVGEEALFRSDKTWYGEKISQGIWVALAHGTREITPRKFVAEDDWVGPGREFTVEVTFTAPVPAFDAVAIATGPENTPDDYCYNGYVVGPSDYNIRHTLTWRRR